MYTIAIVNQKGGSGKSTLCECLAVAAEEAGWASGILDLDPQGTVYAWSKRREDADPPVFSVTPANLADYHGSLAKAGADLTIIDTPARLQDNVLEAANLADLVIVPSKATVKDIERVEASIDLVRIKGDKPILVVFNQVRPQKIRSEEAEAFVRTKNYPVCPVRVGYRVAFEDSDRTGETPLETEPSGKSAEEIRALFEFVKNMLTSENVEKSTSGHEVANG